MNNSTQHNLKLAWSESRSLNGAAIHAGGSSGIYLIGEVNETLGVPVSYDWVYVGRSNNLTRRLLEHLPINEANPGLRTWIKNSGESLIVRFAFVPVKEIAKAEKLLIRSLKPQHNRIMFKNGERT
jgi:hypothetical protein